MGSESVQAVNWSEVRTEKRHPTPGPLDNVGSLLVKIHVNRVLKMMILI